MGLGLVLTVAGSAGATPAARPAVSVYDGHGHRLPYDPYLGPGQRVVVVVHGFRSRTTVTVLDVNTRTRHYVKSDAQGELKVSYRVPRKVLRTRATIVLFAGLPAHLAPARKAMPGKASAKRDPQAVIVTVPLLRHLPYRVHRTTSRITTGSGVAGVGAGPTAAAAGTSALPTGAGGLASTGLDVLGLLGIAAALVVIGLFSKRAGRRRTGAV